MIRSPLFLTWLLGLSASPSVCGQAGDKAGEAQPDLPGFIIAPPAPALSPTEALSRFRIAPGFEIQLVAAEPLVSDPVAMAFDARGRMWVVEMTGLMQDADGTGELDPVGSIAILEDTDADGAMDRRSVFLDELVLPRGVLPLRNGAIVLAPPDLLFCWDSDDDGYADEREVIDTGFRAGLHNPEHAINSPLISFDGWVEFANHNLRYRFVDGVWERQTTGGGGQWGLCQDDFGRLFYNTNSDPLRGDLMPSHYLVRNPNFGKAGGGNVRISHDFDVWPGRVTPGVNRGYRKGTLRPTGELRRYTAACGSVIYRGEVFPEEYHGNAFVCEPSGNLVKRYLVQEQAGGSIRAVDAWKEREFLTSTDERFRPVNAYNGPDGGLYLVDLYRGILQHRVFMTTFLRKQVKARGLETPIGWGRIWRIFPTQTARPTIPKLEGLEWNEIAAELDHPNAWRRERAQQWLIEKGKMWESAHAAVRRVLLNAENPLGRLHALWSLAGMQGLDDTLVWLALHDPHPEVLTAAVRNVEPYLSFKEPNVLGRLSELVRSESGRLRWQIYLSVGTAWTAEADAWVADHFARDVESKNFRGAVLSGYYQREFELLKILSEHDSWRKESKGRQEMFKALARVLVTEGQSQRLERFFNWMAAHADLETWQQRAVLDGIWSGRPKGPDGKPTYISLSNEPSELHKWKVRFAQGLIEQVDRVQEALAWPGKPGLKRVEVRPLTAKESARFERGREVFTLNCATCHQSSGQGEPGKAPPLRYQSYVLGSKERLISLVLGGLQGPLKINGKQWNMEMPAFAANDDDIAAVLTYVRREWGHGAEPITPQEVAAVRPSINGRLYLWTAEELDEAFGMD